MNAHGKATPNDLASEVKFRCVVLAAILVLPAVMAILAARSASGPAVFGSLQGWFSISDSIAFGAVATMIERVAASRRRASGLSQ